MPLNWTRIEEGDTLSNTDLSSKFTAIQGEANALEESSTAKRAFHDEHLPSAAGSATAVSLGTVGHTYINIYPGQGSDVLSSGGTAAGWRIINTGGVYLTAMLSTGVDLTDNKVAGCLIMANIQMSTMADVDSSPNPRHDYLAFFKIQVEMDGTWRSIEESERYSNSEVLSPIATPYQFQVNTHKDVPLRAFVSENSLSVAAGTITGARVLVSVYQPPGMSNPAQPEVTLQHSNLSIIGMYGTATKI